MHFDQCLQRNLLEKVCRLSLPPHFHNTHWAIFSLLLTRRLPALPHCDMNPCGIPPARLATFNLAERREDPSAHEEQEPRQRKSISLKSPTKLHYHESTDESIT